VYVSIADRVLPPLRPQEAEGAVGARGAGEKRKRELDEIEERLLEAERRAPQGGGRNGGRGLF